MERAKVMEKEFAMKKIFCLLCCSLTLLAGDFQIVTEKTRMKLTPRTLEGSEKSQLVEYYVEVVPHLSANDIWKSVLYIRNDSGFSAEFLLEFYDPQGNLVNLEFLDSDSGSNDPWMYGSSFSVTLSGYEIFSLEFNLADGANSFQAFVFTRVEDNVFFSTEALFNRYDGNYKEAAVGVKGTVPEYNILMNVEERTDLFTNTFNYRAFAVTNTEEGYCNCTVDLYDDGYNGANLEGPILRNEVDVHMYGRGKAVWYISDLFDVSLLPKGFGYVWINCDRKVTAMGLTFDEGNPRVAGSVPMDAFVFNKAKDKPAVRKNGTPPKGESQRTR